MWDYAKLSSLAKEFGGPNALVDSIRAEGYSDGMTKGILGTALAFLSLYGGYHVLKWGKSLWDEYLEAKRVEGELARKKLVEEINRYDTMSAHDPTQS